jgi:hypothetical protein
MQRLDIAPAGIRLTAHDLLSGTIARTWRIPQR